MSIIHLSDHIQSVDLSGDLVPALRRAVAALKNGDTLRFPDGEYDLHQEAAEQSLFPVTNHDICARVHGILLRDLQDITLDGQGATLYAHGLVSPLWIENCKNITVKNLRFDRREYLNGSGMVTAAGDGWMELELDPRVNPDWFIWDGILTFQSRYWREPLNQLFEWDANEHIPAPESADNCGGNWQVQWHAEELGKSKIRLSGSFTHPVAVGNQMMLRCAKRYAPGITMSHCENILMQDVTVHACGGMAFIAQRTRDIVLRRCNVLPRPGGLRIDADCYDATHFSNCAGHVLVEDCRFENQLDDATNVHGAYFPVLRILDTHTLRVERSHPQQAGAPVGGCGDAFHLCSRSTGEVYWAGKAKSVHSLNLTSADVSFDEALPAQIPPGDVLDNIDWYPDFTMRRCTMRGNRARATLISTRGKALLEENTFHSPGSAVQMMGGISNWYESGPVRDCTIRNNHFDRCAYNAPIWGNAVFEMKAEGIDTSARTEPHHQNIRIENNRITCANDHVLEMESVGNLIFRENTMERSDGKALGQWHREKDCENIKIEDAK